MYPLKAEEGEAEECLDLALRSIDKIGKASMSELKSLKIPPAMVVDVLAAVMWLIVGKAKDVEMNPARCVPLSQDWRACLLMLRNPHEFLRILSEFTKQKQILEVSLENIEFVRSHFVSSSNFNYEYLRQQNEAAAFMCQWVLASLKYHSLKSK